MKHGAWSGEEKEEMRIVKGEWFEKLNPVPDFG